MTEFGLLRTHGPASDLHDRAVPERVEPMVWWHEVTTPALVLGSAQAIAPIDVETCRMRGIDVVRRRSGGGAVLLLPNEVVWFDVIVPVGLVAETADVRGSMVWIGEIVRAVLDIGTVHDGGLVSTRWSGLICFDGVGPGEILVDDPARGRAKLVGISQRRTRSSARFQVCWHTVYDPSGLPALLRPEHRPPVDELRPVAVLDRGDVAELAIALQANLSAALA